MKKSILVVFNRFILLLYLTLFISLNIFSQQLQRTYEAKPYRDQSLFPIRATGTWTEVHPLIPRVNYWGVHFANADTGWAVGEGGAIIKTTNGGQKWKWYESGIENTLKTVFAINNGQRVIAAGDGGVIIISEDAGESWIHVTSPTIRNLWNMQMITDEIGWMVGEGSAALKTTDGGLTWLLKQMPHTTLPYWDVSFVDLNYGYIAGNNAVILKTTNGGVDWQVQIAGDNRGLYTVYPFDSLTVIAGGGTGKLVITTNGGTDWTQLADLQGNGNINRIKFFDSLNGLLAATVGNFQTTDGGYNWTYCDDLYNGVATWNIDLVDTQNGYVVGGGMFLMKTTDAGIGWIQTVVRDDFHNVYFKDEQNGLINSSSKIYKTTDGGYTLTVLESFPYSSSTMSFIDSLTGFVSTGYPSRIFKTIDGGLSWNNTNISGLTDTTTSVRRVFFLTEETGWAVTGFPGTIIKTTDGGEHWLAQYTLIGGDGFTSIFFIDSLNGWATSRYVHQTTDGGLNWIQRTDIPAFYSNDVYFYNSLKGWIIEGNRLYYTFDGGINWSQDIQIFSFISRFKSISNSHFIITGNIYESIDSGNTWSNITSDIGTGFTDLHAPYNYFCVPVGSNGLILNYLDTTIVPVELVNFSGEVRDFSVYLRWQTITEKNNIGFEVHRKLSGISSKKSDWETIGYVLGHGTTTETHSYSFIDSEVLSGKVKYRLKQIDFDGTFTYSNEIEVDVDITPKEFVLHQNYPNPFNPTTKIKFDIPQTESENPLQGGAGLPASGGGGFVTLKIYDILGNEVATLVNETKPSGTYEVEFSAVGLASGVYFYQLKTGDYIATKKLVLLK